MLEEEDIRNVWNSIKILTADNVVGSIKNGGFKSVLLANLYSATLSIDVIKDTFRPLHLSVSNNLGTTNHTIAEFIAEDIIGKGYTKVGIMYNNNCIHFMKIEKDDIIDDIISKKKKGEKIR